MPIALVLGGGNAVAAYDAGAFEALSEAGHEPDHVAGASAGAVAAALIAGNPPERRVDVLRHFWALLTQPSLQWPWAPEQWRRPAEIRDGLATRLLGRPAMFNLNVSSLFDPSSVPSLYDLDPFRKTLESLVDLSRLNEGPMRVSLLAVDLETGEEVVFDNRQMVLGIDHVLASCAMLPDFPPVSINGRLLVDGGLAANTPVHLVLEPARDSLVCFAVDPFPLSAAPPKRMLDAQERQSDLIYACQTRRSLATYSKIWDLEARIGGKHAARGAAWHLQYHAAEDETALKGFSFGADILRRRWDTGRQDMQAALESWGGQPPSQAGLVIRAMSNK